VPHYQNALFLLLSDFDSALVPQDIAYLLHTAYIKTYSLEQEKKSSDKNEEKTFIGLQRT